MAAGTSAGCLQVKLMRRESTVNTLAGSGGVWGRCGGRGGSVVVVWVGVGAKW